MKKFALFLTLVAVLNACAQNTNILIISGAGNTADNGEYWWDFAGGEYTNLGGIIVRPNSSRAGLWELDGGYFSSNFPTIWYDVGFGGWPAPDPTGAFYSIPSAIQWGVSLTNFWTVPGDGVSFSVFGHNMATTSSEGGLEALLDGNLIYTSTFSAGYGSPFSLNGHISWDGTNLYSSASMESGDPSNIQSAQFYQYNAYSIGTNTFQLLCVNNTNGLLIQSASIIASRTPAGSYQAATNTVIKPGSFTLQ